MKTGAVPIKKIVVQGQEIFVATVFDLMVANVGIDRGHGGDTTQSYDDPTPYTPAWQEPITGVPARDVIRVAREFAENAEKTQGKSMILLGSGTNHWFHSDMTYRTILNSHPLCGCQGVNGGGWAHYTSVRRRFVHLRVGQQSPLAWIGYGLHVSITGRLSSILPRDSGGMTLLTQKL